MTFGRDGLPFFLVKDWACVLAKPPTTNFNMLYTLRKYPRRQKEANIYDEEL